MVGTGSVFFPVTHSLPSGKALMVEITEKYDLGRLYECKLLNIGQNDTYLAKTMAERFIIRVYRSGVRTESDILWEMDLLRHLKGKGVSVSVPIARKDGALVHRINAPEGPRHVAVFPYAKGLSLLLDKEESYLYGKGVADIHSGSDDFHSGHSRFRMDMKYLLDDPLKSVRPILGNRKKGNLEYLTELVDRLWEKFEHMPLKALDWGVCHGDLHGGNAHIADDKKLTFYDFDSGGPGWRAYDLGTFLWETRVREGRKWETVWNSFMNGYTDGRTLRKEDREAIPFFAMARGIWLLGLNTANADDWGYGQVGDSYFNEQLDMLEDWEKQIF